MSEPTPLQSIFKEHSAKFTEHTRTFILAFINHNGEAEVTMAGQDLDIAWLAKLIDMRLNELIAAKKI
jgi:hypothetical protein